MKHDKATCPECLDTCAVSVKGTLRRHPKGAEEPCPGSGFAVRAPDGETARPVTPEREQVKAALTNGVKRAYLLGTELGALIREGAVQRDSKGAVVRKPLRSPEPMLLPRETPPPDDHAILTLVAYVPLPADRSVEMEAADLFEDPGHLYRLLDATDNRNVHIALHVPHVPASAKRVYSESTSPASDPGTTTGAPT